MLSISVQVVQIRSVIISAMQFAVVSSLTIDYMDAVLQQFTVLMLPQSQFN